MPRAFSLCLILYAALFLHACSVGMAASGHKEQDASIIFPGSNRAVIIAKLGPPETSRHLEDGNTEDSSLIREGNASSAGRAWAHAGLDLLSLGLWEVVATPYELAQGEEKTRFLITYNTAGHEGNAIKDSVQPLDGLNRKNCLFHNVVFAYGGGAAKSRVS